MKAAKFLMGLPSLWVWAILPALINLVLFVAVLYVLLSRAGGILESLWTRPEVVVAFDWLLFGLWYLVFAIIYVAAIVLAYFLVLMVSGVIASPFKDKLSCETELALTGRINDARDGESKVVGILRSLGKSLATLVLYLGCMVPLLLLNLIPVVGSAAYTALAGSLSALFIALDYTDSPLDRRGFGFVQKLRIVRSDLDLAGGFGAGMALILAVPVVNLLAMPIAVVGGTAVGLVIGDGAASPES